MSVLTIGQKILDDVGISRPTSFIGNTNPTARRVVRAIQKAGTRIYKSHSWTALHVRQRFNTSASTVEFGFADDFHRFIPETDWDEGNYWRLQQLTPKEWRELKSGQLAAGIRVRWRVMKGETTNRRVFVIDSSLHSPSTLIFEYVSKYWVISAAGVGSTTLTADSDNIIAFDGDEELMELDALWRLKKSLGQQDWRDDRAEAVRAIRVAIAQDGGAPSLSLNGTNIFARPFPPNIPETGYGQ